MLLQLQNYMNKFRISLLVKATCSPNELIYQYMYTVLLNYPLVHRSVRLSVNPSIPLHIN